jgi:hypothetical protein
MAPDLPHIPNHANHHELILIMTDGSIKQFIVSKKHDILPNKTNNSIALNR